ncbi:MAG: type IX secretion system membrane protein PorP/SprF [Prolixibacteraceae bacterium]|nr:type IX secretion system membrane protein PorP/SprF [Prolixibacteraceae bacterium]
MKRKITLYILFVFLFVAEASAQQAFQYRYHIFDDYLLNPGYVGSKNYYPILIGRDQRFYGLNDGVSPDTYYLSLHSRVGEGYMFSKDGKINKFFEKFGNMAFGLQLFQYSYGPTVETNIGVTYGYHLDLNQNYKRKNQRKLILALTPRVKRLGVNGNALELNNDPLGGNSAYYDSKITELADARAWMFSADVGALYKTVHGEFGVAALDIVQSKNKMESEFLYINEISYETYDSLYPTKFLVNGKLTYIDMYNSAKIDVKFIPSLVAIYAPKTQASEFYVDLMLESIFKEHIAGIRSEIVMTGQLGLNIHHSRIYEPSTFLQPYVTFDFKNITITYAQTINIDGDLARTAGISGGGQISVILKLSNDRVIRAQQKKVSWHD